MKNLKYNRNLAFGLIILTMSIFYGCFGSISGSGPIISKSKNVGQFTEITLEIPAKITLVIADSAGCGITAQQNIIDNIEFKLNGDKLRITSKHNFRTDKAVEITLATSTLEQIKINGSGDIIVLNPIKGSSLDLAINGSGNISVNAFMDEIVSKINGSGDIIIGGKAATHRIDLNGSGNLKGYELIVEKCEVNIKGSGNAELNASSSLDAELIGSGNVSYKGSPAIKSNITGSGTLTKIN